MSVHTLSAEDTLEESIFSELQFHDNQDLFHLLIGCAQMAQAEPKLLYESPGGNLVGGLPPAAHWHFFIAGKSYIWCDTLDVLG